jgi:formate/nitrite transporter FocA (FNT family)
VSKDSDSREEEHLSQGERQDVAEHQRLTSPTIYAIVRREGLEELRRPTASLWWSGIAAGLALSTSFIAQGVLYAELEEHPYRSLLASFGYALGFILVILSRLQLFTENTLTVLLPFLQKPNSGILRQIARLWSVVLVANLVGTGAVALLMKAAPIMSPEHMSGMLEVAGHYLERSALECFVQAIPGGLYIAAIVWMLPSAKGSEIFLITAFTVLMVIGGFTHVITGSAELFALVLEGRLDPLRAIGSMLLPVLLGNILGGSGLFALLAYGQVRQEM